MSLRIKNKSVFASDNFTFLFSGFQDRCTLQEKVQKNTQYTKKVQYVQNTVQFRTCLELYYEEGGCDFCGKSFYTKEFGLMEEDYSYDEGRYIFDKDNFFESCDSDIDNLFEIDEDVTFESVKERFSFITGEQDLKILEEIYNEVKERYGEETES